jgi:hypothetical protein
MHVFDVETFESDVHVFFLRLFIACSGEIAIQEIWRGTFYLGEGRTRTCTRTIDRHRHDIKGWLLDYATNL